jgi:hypothetical protein
MTLLSLGQSQKEVTVNAALRILDAVSNIGVKDKDLNTPPGSPVESDLYIIGPSPTGAWAGRAKQLAVYTGGVWVYIPPKEGVCFWVMDEDVVYVYNGTAWVTLSSGQSLQNVPMVGINATANSTDKFYLATSSAVQTNVGGSTGYLIDKAATGNNAQTQYSVGLSRRAQMGLIGNDDFTLRVSADDITWNTALTVARATGACKAGQPFEIPQGSASAPAIFPNGDTDSGMYQVAGNILGFSVGGSEVFRIASGGLSFDGGTTYEKVEVGTWTPLLQGATTPGTPTYTYNAGTYRKVGSHVTCFLRMNISARGGLTGTVQLAGLPFASSSATNHVGGAILGLITGVSVTAGVAPSWRSVIGTSTMELYGSGNTTGTASLTETSITDSFHFRGFLIYRT